MAGDRHSIIQYQIVDFAAERCISDFIIARLDGSVLHFLDLPRHPTFSVAKPPFHHGAKGASSVKSQVSIAYPVFGCFWDLFTLPMQEIIKKIGEAKCEIRYQSKGIDSVKLKMYQHRRMGLTMKSSKPKSTRPGALDFSWCFNWQRRNADCQPVFACQEGCKKLHIVDVWTVEPASILAHGETMHEHKLSISQPIWFDMQWHLPGACLLAAKMRFTLPGAVHVCP